MLGEYKVSRCTRRCFTQDRPLREGEWYYSVVIEDGDEFQRRDYSAESWSEPPEEAIGWWKCRMPTKDQKKLVPAPPAVLIQLLRQMLVKAKLLPCLDGVRKLDTILVD